MDPIDSHDKPVFHEIRVKGLLSTATARWLGDLKITVLPGGECLLRGRIADQAALYGLVARMRDLGLVLISVNRCAEQGEARGAQCDQSKER